MSALSNSSLQLPTVRNDHSPSPEKAVSPGTSNKLIQNQLKNKLLINCEERIAKLNQNIQIRKDFLPEIKSTITTISGFIAINIRLNGKKKLKDITNLHDRIFLILSRLLVVVFKRFSFYTEIEKKIDLLFESRNSENFPKNYMDFKSTKLFEENLEAQISRFENNLLKQQSERNVFNFLDLFVLLDGGCEVRDIQDIRETEKIGKIECRNQSQMTNILTLPQLQKPVMYGIDSTGNRFITIIFKEKNNEKLIGFSITEKTDGLVTRTDPVTNLTEINNTIKFTPQNIVGLAESNYFHKSLIGGNIVTDEQHQQLQKLIAIGSVEINSDQTLVLATRQEIEAAKQGYRENQIKNMASPS